MALFVEYPFSSVQKSDETLCFKYLKSFAKLFKFFCKIGWNKNKIKIKLFKLKKYFSVNLKFILHLHVFLEQLRRVQHVESVTKSFLGDDFSKIFVAGQNFVSPFAEQSCLVQRYRHRLQQRNNFIRLQPAVDRLVGEQMRVADLRHSFHASLLALRQVIRQPSVYVEVAVREVDVLLHDFRFWADGNGRKWNLPNGRRLLGEAHNHRAQLPLLVNLVN